MKTLLLIKRIDLGAQLLLMGATFLAVLFARTGLMWDLVLGLGIWQAGSALGHLLLFSAYRSSERKAHGLLFLFLALGGAASLATGSLIMLLAILIVSLGVLIWYPTICYADIKSVAWRDSFHMKR